MMKSIQPTAVLEGVSDIPKKHSKECLEHSHNRMIATAIMIMRTWWYPIMGMKPVP